MIKKNNSQKERVIVKIQRPLYLFGRDRDDCAIYIVDSKTLEKTSNTGFYKFSKEDMKEIFGTTKTLWGEVLKHSKVYIYAYYDDKDESLEFGGKFEPALKDKWV